MSWIKENWHKIAIYAGAFLGVALGESNFVLMVLAAYFVAYLSARWAEPRYTMVYSENAYYLAKQQLRNTDQLPQTKDRTGDLLRMLAIIEVVAWIGALTVLALGVAGYEVSPLVSSALLALAVVAGFKRTESIGSPQPAEAIPSQETIPAQDPVLATSGLDPYAQEEMPDCPRCDDDRVKKIYYSIGCAVFMVEDEWLADDVYEPGSPNWHCLRCGHEWGLSEAPTL